MMREAHKSDSTFEKDNWNLAFRLAERNGLTAIVKDILKETKTIDKDTHLIFIHKAAQQKKYDLLEALVENSLSIRSIAIEIIFTSARTTHLAAPDLTAIKTVLATGPILDKTRDLTLENTSLNISLKKDLLKSGDVDADNIAFFKQVKKDYTEIRTTMEEAETVNTVRLCLAIDAYRLFVRKETAKEFGYELPA